MLNPSRVVKQGQACAHVALRLKVLFGRGDEIGDMEDRMYFCVMIPGL